MQKKGSLGNYFRHHFDLYLLLVPSLIFVIIFNLVPMTGITLAFKDYNMFLMEDGEMVSPMMAIFKSPNAGWQHFRDIFKQDDFWNAFRNTLIISVYKIIFIFPLPIIFAIFLNEVRSLKFQKGLQLIVYLPHFLSWVVVGGIFVSLLSGSGVVNNLIRQLGGTPVRFLIDKSKFRSILVISDAWKSVGWSSIIYFAAITGLDQSLYESADIDGASRLQKIWYITVPGLLSTIVLMLIIRVGNIMGAGFDQIFVMYSPPVYEVSDIIGTYVYRTGLGRLQFSRGTAIGLFNSAISLVLVLSSNYFAKRASGKSIW